MFSRSRIEKDPGYQARIEERLKIWAWADGRVLPETSFSSAPLPEPDVDRSCAPGLSSHLSRTVAFNLALTVLGLAAAGLVPFGFNLAVGRMDGAAILGPISIALGLALFLGQLPGTISATATKFIAESLGQGDELRARSVFGFLLVVTSLLSVALGVALVALSSVIVGTYHISYGTVFLAAALIPAYALYLYFKSAYYGFQLVRIYLLNEVISDAAFFAVLAVVFFLGATPWLLFPFVLNNLLFVSIAVRDMAPFLRNHVWPSHEDRRRVLRYCVVNGSGTAASLGRWSLGTAIAGLFLTHHAVGLFAASVAITAPLPLLPRAISLVTFAIMARLHGAGEAGSIRAILQQSTEWLVFLLGIPSGLAIINAPAILSLLFRPDFAHAAVATQLIIAGAYVTDISRPSIDALSSTRHVRIATVASFAGLGLSMVLWLALIPRFGISMAGLGFAAGAVVTAAIPAYYAHRHIGSHPAVFVRPAVMLAALLLLTVLGGRSPLLASAVFAVGTTLIYRHLIQDGLRVCVRAYRGRMRLTEKSA